MKETSESDSIGEFLFVSGEVEYVVFVMKSLKTREQVVQPGKTYGRCDSFRDQFYTDEFFFFFYAKKFMVLKRPGILVLHNRAKNPLPV